MRRASTTILDDTPYTYYTHDMARKKLTALWVTLQTHKIFKVEAAKQGREMNEVAEAAAILYTQRDTLEEKREATETAQLEKFIEANERLLTLLGQEEKAKETM